MTAWIAAKTVFSTARYSAATLLESQRGRLTPTRADIIIRGWAQSLLNHAELRVTVSGLENIAHQGTYVVMSNHQSLYDIPALHVALPLTLRMIAKSELFRVPLWSHAMLASGYVPIHRGDHTKALQDLRAAQKALQSGISIWIAPEGTRSPDGELLEFKPGGFHLASAVRYPILPVTINGTRHALPAKALSATRGIVAHVTIGAPIDPRAFGRSNRGQLIEAVRRAIQAPLLANP
ncbi:MAG TPA: lysophospholipid acyltransferase family protein [Polyangiaceae bacterium]